MFEINPGLIIWTIITFVILAGLLGKYAWRPMLQALQDRENSIRDALAQAERARAEATEMIKQNEQNTARAEQEYQRMMRDARAMAERMKQEIVSKAQQQARHELDKANEELKHNLDAARVQLRNEVADLAVKAAEKILDETLDAAKQKKIVDTFIAQLPKN